MLSRPVCATNHWWWLKQTVEFRMQMKVSDGTSSSHHRNYPQWYMYTSQKRIESHLRNDGFEILGNTLQIS